MKQDLENIKVLMKQLKKACYEMQIPMISVIAYKENNEQKKDKIVAEMISPAAVEYEPYNEKNIRVFYDLSNLVTGKFKTVPIERLNEDQ